MVTINKVKIPLPKNWLLKVAAAAPIYVGVIVSLVACFVAMLVLGAWNVFLLGIDEGCRWGWRKMINLLKKKDKDRDIDVLAKACVKAGE